MVGDAERVLGEGGVVVAVGVGRCRSKVLQIVLGDGVSISPQGRERKPSFLGLEGKWIYLDDVEKIFTALLAGEKVVDPGEQCVAAELEGVAAGIEADRFCELGAMLPCGTG